MKTTVYHSRGGSKPRSNNFMLEDIENGLLFEMLNGEVLLVTANSPASTNITLTSLYTGKSEHFVRGSIVDNVRLGEWKVITGCALVDREYLR